MGESYQGKTHVLGELLEVLSNIHTSRGMGVDFNLIVLVKHRPFLWIRALLSIVLEGLTPVNPKRVINLKGE